MTNYGVLMPDGHWPCWRALSSKLAYQDKREVERVTIMPLANPGCVRLVLDYCARWQRARQFDQGKYYWSLDAGEVHLTRRINL